MGRVAWLLLSLGSAAVGVDLALSSNGGAWLQHPVVGGPSYDAWAFAPANPVYVGAAPRPWVVNGVLWLPGNATSAQCILAGQYPRGYGMRGGVGSNMRALASADGGVTWVPGAIVVAGDNASYDRGGSTPDGFAVVDGARTRLLYDWATPDDADGGLGYAEGPSGACDGPFARATAPVVAESTLPVLPPPHGAYRRVYGGSLLRRGASDWLILAALSTAGNAGGTWALCAMTAPAPGGPWTSPPAVVLAPQDAGWHAHPTEFYPAFAAAGFAFAPATSISANRGYQVVWRAPLAAAHTPGAWSVLHDGSAWHWDPRAGGGGAIWGQTFSAVVSADGASVRAMWPSLAGAGGAASVGSLNLASAPWGGAATGIGQRASGFTVSAPAAPSLALTAHALAAAADVTVVADAAAAAGAAAPSWALVWNSAAPVGADGWPFPGGMHGATRCDATSLELAADGFRLTSLPPGPACAARAVPLAAGAGCAVGGGAALTVRVTQSADGHVNVTCNGVVVVAGVAVAAPGGASALGGRAGVLAAAGTAVTVARFDVAAGWLGGAGAPPAAAVAPPRAPPPPPPPPPAPYALLATDGMTGAGNLARGWRADATPGRWRFAAAGGIVCDTGAPCERAAKWNFVGIGVALWAPAGLAGQGNVTMSVDGGAPDVVDLARAVPGASTLRWASAPLAAGHHAVTMRAVGSATLAVDSVDVTPAPSAVDGIMRPAAREAAPAGGQPSQTREQEHE